MTKLSPELSSKTRRAMDALAGFRNASIANLEELVTRHQHMAEATKDLYESFDEVLARIEISNDLRQNMARAASLLKQIEGEVSLGVLVKKSDAVAYALMNVMEYAHQSVTERYRELGRKNSSQ